MKVGSPESISILGTKVSVFDSYDHALDLIRRRISSRLRTFCVAINPEKVYRAGTDPGLHQALESADIRLCDGVGVSLASMMLYRRRLVRCTGIDLFLKLIRLAPQEGWKVFLLGASHESNHAACRALRNAHPGLKIVGEDGYFKNSATVVERINKSGADLLFVGIGSPRQERWINEHKAQLKTTFNMGIGGSLDVVSGATKRAPEFFQRTGTEWLFRLLLQPNRLRRQMALVLFMLRVMDEIPVTPRSSKRSTTVAGHDWVPTFKSRGSRPSPDEDPAAIKTR